jgi:hypothetical protein
MAKLLFKFRLVCLFQEKSSCELKLEWQTWKWVKKKKEKYMRENTLLLGIQMYNHYEKNQ